jgi:Mg2+ and Co2+ transporter CorA
MNNQNPKAYADMLEHVASEWEVVARNAQHQAQRLREFQECTEENIEILAIHNSAMRAAFHCTHKGLMYALKGWRARVNSKKIQDSFDNIGQTIESYEKY